MKTDVFDFIELLKAGWGATSYRSVIPKIPTLLPLNAEIIINELYRNKE